MDYLTTKELAQQINIGESTIRKWRSDGTGPDYVRVGRLIRYQAAAVDEWMSNGTTRSTNREDQTP